MSQAEPRELTNRRTRQRVTAIAHDQRTPPSSLPVLVRVETTGSGKTGGNMGG